MKIMDFNILFLIIFINSNCVLNANKIKFQTRKAEDCIVINEANEKFELETAVNNSKTSNATFFVFFSNRKDNFGWLKSLAGPLNRLLEGELNLIFHCANYTAANAHANANANFTFDSEEKYKRNVLDFYVVKNGNVEKNETLTFLSRKYVAYLLNEFNLTHYLEKKYPLSDQQKKKPIEAENLQLTSFIELTMQVKSETDLKKTFKNPDNDLKPKQEKINDAATTNNFLKKLKNTNEIQNLPPINTECPKCKIHSEVNENLNSPRSDEKDLKPNTPRPSVFNLKKNKSEILNKTEEDKKSNKNLREKEEAEEEEEMSFQTYSNSALKEHSMKTVSQLKRVSESQIYSSFIEKETLSFTDAIENSKITFFPNKNGVFSLAEINQSHNSFFNFIDVFKDFESSANRPINRLSRFFLALFIVLISSLLCFLFIKYSIDWATKSKTELNSLQDRENREILEEINKNYNLVRFN